MLSFLFVLLSLCTEPYISLSYFLCPRFLIIFKTILFSLHLSLFSCHFPIAIFVCILNFSIFGVSISDVLRTSFSFYLNFFYPQMQFFANLYSQFPLLSPLHHLFESFFRFPPLFIIYRDHLSAPGTSISILPFL